jgi:tellurite resistance protein TerC
MLPTTGTPLLYAVFGAIVTILLAIDLWQLRRQGSHKISMKEAGGWVGIWVAAALAFGLWYWWYLDATYGRAVANEHALEYLTGYVLEMALAADNVFVWVTLFTFFAVPIEYQKRVLVYGLLGAIVMRAVMIFVGAVLIAKFHWILYVFGAILVVSGIKMWFASPQSTDLHDNGLLKWLRGHLRMVNEYHGDRFFVVKDGLRYATPLFIVVVFVELTDLIFAVDSIPAVFAVTTDPFVVFTSNIFAILCLRSMYFLLKELADRFYLLHYGLAVILVFIGAKMLIMDWYKIPIGVALAVVGVVLLTSVLASWLGSRNGKAHEGTARRPA